MMDRPPWHVGCVLGRCDLFTLFHLQHLHRLFSLDPLQMADRALLPFLFAPSPTVSDSPHFSEGTTTVISCFPLLLSAFSSFFSLFV
jgi:hypothetical protein